MNAMHVGYTLHDHKDATCKRACVAAMERESSSDNVKAQRLVDRSLNGNLLTDNQAQDSQSDRDKTDVQKEVSLLSMNDSNICEQSQVEDFDRIAEEPV